MNIKDLTTEELAIAYIQIKIAEKAYEINYRVVGSVLYSKDWSKDPILTQLKQEHAELIEIDVQLRFRKGIK